MNSLFRILPQKYSTGLLVIQVLQINHFLRLQLSSQLLEMRHAFGFWFLGSEFLLMKHYLVFLEY